MNFLLTINYPNRQYQQKMRNEPILIILQTSDWDRKPIYSVWIKLDLCCRFLGPLLSCINCSQRKSRDETRLRSKVVWFLFRLVSKICGRALSWSRIGLFLPQVFLTRLKKFVMNYTGWTLPNIIFMRRKAGFGICLGASSLSWSTTIRWSTSHHRLLSDPKTIRFGFVEVIKWFVRNPFIQLFYNPNCFQMLKNGWYWYLKVRR